MEIDIKIYLNNLRGFFNSGNISSRKKVNLSKQELDKLMDEVEVIAVKNYNDSNDPTLSRKQMLEALSKVTQKQPKKVATNNTYFTLPELQIGVIKGYGEISITY